MSSLTFADLERCYKQLSPGMQQYVDIKRQYLDCILLYRMGDFYETFVDDAVLTSRALELILTVKSCGLEEEKAPMCGVPHHAAQNYVSRLVSAGYKVAICEQNDKSEGEKGLFKRVVTRVITPGTIIDGEMLVGSKNNYLLSVYFDENKVGASYVDISTGEFEVINIEDNINEQLSDLISRINPSEILSNEEGAKLYNNLSAVVLGARHASKYYDWAYSLSRARSNLTEHFGENFEKVYDLKGLNNVIIASGALLEYLKETQKKTMSNINKIKLVRNGNFLTLDMNTRRNLELTESNRDRKKTGSLLWVLDKTKTSMGARYLRKMIGEPLQDLRQINRRLDAVEELSGNLILRDKLSKALDQIFDIERISAKIAYGNINPKEVVTLGASLKKIPALKEALSTASSDLLVSLNNELVDLSQIESMIENAFESEVSASMKDGGFIKAGYNRELDEYRNAKKNGNDWLNKLQEKEIEATGIKTLRIGYNKVFGYYIEVSKGQLEKVPLSYIRKQTTVNGERFITEDLKQLEDMIVGSGDKAIALEKEIFKQIKEILLRYLKSFQAISQTIAKIDFLNSLASVAVKNNYTRPNISKNSKSISIVDGRHPVVEQYLTSGEFVSNDTNLDEDENRIMVITGPNMSGKSTYMRQVALITLLAHIGSFVPAKKAEVCFVDRIFTRVGASDDLALGQSTFMVEMSEVALILANATDKSLILLDEIGRGTSTFDGLSIAWSVIEYISKHFRAKTLFATHYHELTELEGVLDGVKNYKIAVKEQGDKVVFLRKIVRGGANKSFGVEVARLAGVPQEVIERAKEISQNLESVNQKLDLNLFKDERKEKSKLVTASALSILSILKDIDINTLTPLHAFDILNDLITKAKEN